MEFCEQCWLEARSREFMRRGKSANEYYQDILEEPIHLYHHPTLEFIDGNAYVTIDGKRTRIIPEPTEVNIAQVDDDGNLSSEENKMKASDLFKELENHYIELSEKSKGLGAEIEVTQTYTMKKSGLKIDVKIYRQEEED